MEALELIENWVWSVAHIFDADAEADCLVLGGGPISLANSGNKGTDKEGLFMSSTEVIGVATRPEGPSPTGVKGG